MKEGEGQAEGRLSAEAQPLGAQPGVAGAGWLSQAPYQPLPPQRVQWEGHGLTSYRETDSGPWAGTARCRPQQAAVLSGLNAPSLK